MSEAELADLRRRIDEVDRDIVGLLNRRADISLAIGRAKANAAPAGDHASTGPRSPAEAPAGAEDVHGSARPGRVYDPAREAVVYERLLAQSSGPLPAEALRAIYREILSSSRGLQAPLTVAFLGPEATFSHEGALSHFGSFARLRPVATIPDVFRETEVGRSDYGIVPIENSTEGAVTFTLDSFVDSELKACAEVQLEIHQALMARGSLSEVRTVYSHPQALAQCRDWLRAHLPGVPLVATASTAAAAERAAGEESAAAVGPEIAAQVYGLTVLEPRIEDVAGNVTRFLVIGPQMGQRTGYDRMALLFSIKDRVGVLRDVLGLFSGAGINLSKIESRPSKRRAWDYLFFADLDAHPEDEGVPAALEELRDLTVFSKVLGAWRRSA